MKKKVIIIIVILSIIFISGISGSVLFINSKKMSYSIKDKLEVNIHDKVYNVDFLKKVKNGVVVSKKSLIDTSKLGNVKVKLEVKNYFKRIKNISYTLNIVDKEAPSITFNNKLSIEEGNELDLLKDVKVEDNSLEDIKATVVGDYDLKTPNTYNLEYVAVDSSGNEKREKFTLEVTKKVEVKAPTRGYVAPDRNFTTANGHSGRVVNGITYIDGVLIANKTYPLPSTYNPGGLDGEMWQAFEVMQKDAGNQGISLWLKSGYRSYNTQVGLYNSYVARDGKAAADTYSARPGHSEHQTGLGFDLNKIDDNFGNEPEGIWLANNAWKYGFVLRYPQGKSNETGYMYESWHYRYVGKDLASKLYNGGNWITLESYFGITSQYNY